MTFKDIRILSRRVTYVQLATAYIECLKRDDYKRAHLYYSMICIKQFKVCKNYIKIINWREAVKAYKFYKKRPDESLKIKTKHLP